MPKETCSLLLRNISRKMREEFKSACSRRGSDMTKEIVKFMEETITRTNNDSHKGKRQ